MKKKIRKKFFLASLGTFLVSRLLKNLIKDKYKERYFSDKVVWITGASSGIGESLAYELSKYGTTLIISSRKEDQLNRVKNECLNPSRVHVVPLDLEKLDEIPDKVKLALDSVNKVDILVNNGGISQRSLIKETDMSVYKRLMDINYFGTVKLSNELLPHFVENKKGHIAVVTSLMGMFSSPMRGGYCASKHALHGYFDTLRAEYHDNNVKVTMICPGFVQTNISMNSLTGFGQTQNSMDSATEQGITSQQCADKIIEALYEQKEEVYIGKKEVLGIYMKRFFPRVLSKMIRKAKVT